MTPILEFLFGLVKWFGVTQHRAYWKYNYTNLPFNYFIEIWENNYNKRRNKRYLLIPDLPSSLLANPPNTMIRGLMPIFRPLTASTQPLILGWIIRPSTRTNSILPLLSSIRAANTTNRSSFKIIIEKSVPPLNKSAKL
jgi:hypothetical protein